MEAILIIEEWQRRLQAMADKPPYVFRETAPQLIEKHHRKLTTFVGYSDILVTEVERRLDVRFSSLFRAYLRQMAKSPGDLFCGSDLAGPIDLEQFRTDASDLIAESGAELMLPADAIVFLFHQGYAFCYVLASGGIDGPVWQWTEGEAAPNQIALSFAEFVNAEIEGMEINHRESHRMGGFYLTLHPGGGQTESHPALNSGERPFDIGKEKPR